YINKLRDGSIYIDIVVRAFVNVNRLDIALKRDSKLQNSRQLRDSITRFNN
ncbi:hypothetical protein LZ31DRAFT_479247, partial [Colletotrichum somersetense]